ncbi:MAG: PfkB family carbohydrate kinase [Sphaerochaetaceae bacterium]|jgi:2-dehydro-3-deoxygluconokinase|nr:PfkB family carbohydrate kinase [Sphaerochaetaceae bacterium]MDD3162658.1 PfkB family carbohydrate kinase [Sphaerochaetaceae bacterium]MDD4006904.1 PfkB family carbohydrate kinase [Sphaerochaetaceae bacterium]MDD4396133.1 PfkB family carbohydrate kinase [Sphaerochaetaceae bacterium]
MLNLKKNCRYDLVCPTSMGVRITPVGRMPVHTSSMFEMQATSAESNVLNVSSSLGLHTKVLTAFVKDSPIAAFIKAELRFRNIEFEGPDVPQGGAWGYRHQFNIADSGFGGRGPRVWNDRSGEVGRSLKASDFDLHRIFDEEGVRILHLSGLVAALSHETTEFCLAVARAAKASGTLISFDLNYRASFWKGREAELRKAFTEIASISDILIGNEEDYQLALGLEGPEAGGKDLEKKMEQFKGMIGEARRMFPDAKVFATTLREVVSANEHNWGALLLSGENWYIENPRPIQIMDRIGGGDGFVGGLLYAILSGKNEEDWIKMGWATGALATTVTTDYCTPADEEQIWSVYQGNARVKR